jgi:hypothetical protein
VLAVPLLMGGITNGEFWRMVLVLMDTFLLSLAIGVFVSVLSWNARRAMGANFLLLLLITAIPAAGAGTIAYFSSSSRVIDPLLYSCPVYSFDLSSDAKYKWGAEHFWSSIAVIHGLTWLLVALACWLVSRSWQDRPAAAGKIGWRDRWQGWSYGGPSRREALRKRLLDINAFYWLAARAWFKPIGVWLGLAFVGCWWLYMRLALQFSWFDESFSLTTGFILNCLLKLWIAVEAGQRFAEDQKIGALELWLSTPLTVGDILGGQLLALRRQFLGPLLVTVAVELLLVFTAAQHSFQNRSEVLAFGLGGLILLLADVSALICVAISQALTARTPNRANVTTIVRILILPTVLYGAVGVVAFIWTTSLGVAGPEWKFYVRMWFWLGIITDLAYGLPAWWQLRTRFRQLAVQRFATSQPQSRSENP